MKTNKSLIKWKRVGDKLTLGNLGGTVVAAVEKAACKFGAVDFVHEFGLRGTAAVGEGKLFVDGHFAQIAKGIEDGYSLKWFCTSVCGKKCKEWRGKLGSKTIFRIVKYEDGSAFISEECVCGMSLNCEGVEQAVDVAEGIVATVRALIKKGAVK